MKSKTKAGATSAPQELLREIDLIDVIDSRHAQTIALLHVVRNSEQQDSPGEILADAAWGLQTLIEQAHEAVQELNALRMKRNAAGGAA